MGPVDFVRLMEEALIRRMRCVRRARRADCGTDGRLVRLWWRSRGRAAKARKIGAIGIHVSRGITSHGFAFNVTTDLRDFQLINPCGITDKPVTSLEREMADPVRLCRRLKRWRTRPPAVRTGVRAADAGVGEPGCVASVGAESESQSGESFRRKTRRCRFRRKWNACRAIRSGRCGRERNCMRSGHSVHASSTADIYNPAGVGSSPGNENRRQLRRERLMPTDVVMPQMGESIFEGTITKWLKKSGDAVEKDEPLFEISTDKVDAEIPSPVSGVLSEIKFAGRRDRPDQHGGGDHRRRRSHRRRQGKNRPCRHNRRRPRRRRSKRRTRLPRGAASGQVSSPTEVVMPQMGESIFEGTITKWLEEGRRHGGEGRAAV